jgi:hypothetical protein
LLAEQAQERRLNTPVSDIDVDSHKLNDQIFRKPHVGSYHRIRVAFRDEYVRADCFRRIGGDELHRFRTLDGEPVDVWWQQFIRFLGTWIR